MTGVICCANVMLACLRGRSFRACGMCRCCRRCWDLRWVQCDLAGCQFCWQPLKLIRTSSYHTDARTGRITRRRQGVNSRREGEIAATSYLTCLYTKSSLLTVCSESWRRSSKLLGSPACGPILVQQASWEPWKEHLLGRRFPELFVNYHTTQLEVLEKKDAHACVFWDTTPVLLSEYEDQGTCIADSYREDSRLVGGMRKTVGPVLGGAGYCDGSTSRRTSH